MAAKINMRLDKNEMPSQDPQVRNKNFLEVALGYTEEQALDEAARCLNCKNHPCVDGCPVNVRIPEFIQKIVEKDYEGAYQVIHQTSSLPAVCGRVCPQESQCEMHCVRGKKGDPVGIGRLERFVADWHNAHSTEAPAKPATNGHKVAIIGSGPAGLTCAGDLAKKGYEVTVFEALHLAGGVLVYGIPEFRLPKDIVQHEVEGLKELGVDIECNMVIGKVLTIDELMNDYGFEAIYVASGAGLPRFMGIPGESLNGVYSANEYLTRVNLMKAYKEDSHTPIMKSKAVAVVGGGNVAMDATRTAVRLGAESVKCVYRRRISDMTALPEEIEGAMAEGCEILPLKAPVEIEVDQDGKVAALVVQPQVIGEVRGGRPAPRDADQPQERIPCDVVLMAVGQAVDSAVFAQAGVPTKRDTIVTGDDGSVPGMAGVFSGGDCVSGPATVILAIEAGKVAAASIDEYLGCHTDISANLEIPPAPFRLKHATGRVDLTEREASWRKNDFELMENCMSQQEMAQECSRCLRCDHYGHAGFKGGRRTTW